MGKVENNRRWLLFDASECWWLKTAACGCWKLELGGCSWKRVVLVKKRVVGVGNGWVVLENEFWHPKTRIARWKNAPQRLLWSLSVSFSSSSVSLVRSMCSVISVSVVTVYWQYKCGRCRKRQVLTVLVWVESKNQCLLVVLSYGKQKLVVDSQNERSNRSVVTRWSSVLWQIPV
jgi:hypothetical protein